jgi:hypothetical protein
MSNVRENVENLMDRFPDTRSDDRLLIMMYWTHKDGIKVSDSMVNVWDVIRNTTSAESITRARRLVQKEGLYPATPEVQAERKGKAAKMKGLTLGGQVI